MIHSRLAKLATIAAALAAFTGAVHAQEALKIAIMDIEKVRASYWKTQMSMKQVAEREAVRARAFETQYEFRHVFRL